MLQVISIVTRLIQCSEKISPLSVHTKALLWLINMVRCEYEFLILPINKKKYCRYNRPPEIRITHFAAVLSWCNIVSVDRIYNAPQNTAISVRS